MVSLIEKQYTIKTYKLQVKNSKVEDVSIGSHKESLTIVNISQLEVLKTLQTLTDDVWVGRCLVFKQTLNNLGCLFSCVGMPL